MVSPLYSALSRHAAMLTVVVLGCGGSRGGTSASATSAAEARHTDDCSWYDTNEEARLWDEPTRTRLRHVCEIEAEFERFVADNRACSADSDCTIVITSCPLGCGHAVASSRTDAATAKHDELRTRYRTADGDCATQCEPPTRATCDNGSCVSAR